VSRHRPLRSDSVIPLTAELDAHLPAQDGNLVAAHDDLDRQVLFSITGETGQLPETDEAVVEERERAAPSSSSVSRQRKSRSLVPMTFSAPTLEPGRRIELLTYALRVGPHAFLEGSGDVSTCLTRSFQIRPQYVPVRGVHVYGVDMGWTVGQRNEVDGGERSRDPMAVEATVER
jgi:hypothetical protein